MPFEPHPTEPNTRIYVPLFMDRVTGFVVTYVEWVKAGMPRRNPDEVKEIFETHCKTCEYYKPNKRSATGVLGRCDHEACGCHVSDNPKDLRNKITIPQASCDDGRWGNVVEPPPQGNE